MEREMRKLEDWRGIGGVQKIRDLWTGWQAAGTSESWSRLWKADGALGGSGLNGIITTK